ncbi:MAG: type IV pilus modification protein PilV [Betaproteobacteria bacterium]|nr:type IV pilus modification protein PilV [Betaproteobacteria bacterium]
MQRHSCTSSSRFRQERGFTLLEVLVSITVLAIGLLGVAALQGVGLRASGSAHYRTQAAWFATQIIEEARAHRASVVGGAADVVDPSLAAVPCGSTPATTIGVWRARIACSLPAGQGAVNYNAITQRLQVTIQWDDQRGVDTAKAGGNTAANFVIQTVL